MSNYKKKPLPDPPLFIGRFQPFHNGHFDVVEQMLEPYDHIIIGIGSSQYSDQPDNPFSAELRQKMIVESLKAAGIPSNAFELVQIPDIHDDVQWVKHVEATCPPFGTVYTGTPEVQRLFEVDGTHPVVRPYFNVQVSGTMVRHLIQRGSIWEDKVPSPVAALLKKDFTI